MKIQILERDKGKFKKGHSGFWKGKKLSEETKKKMGLARKGQKRSQETKDKLSKSKIGDKNPSWKGNKVKYRALHQWIRMWKKKSDNCEDCGKKGRLHIANISGKYKRDVDDFEWLCSSCHKIKDNRRKIVK